MAPGTSPELLVSLGRRGLGRIDVVRVTPGGSATRRESLFDRATLTRWWSTGMAPAMAVAGSPKLVLSVLQRGRLAS
jgi:hypothetical protein